MQISQKKNQKIDKNDTRTPALTTLEERRLTGDLKQKFKFEKINWHNGPKSTPSSSIKSNKYRVAAENLVY